MKYLCFSLYLLLVVSSAVCNETNNNPSPTSNMEINVQGDNGENAKYENINILISLSSDKKIDGVKYNYDYEAMKRNLLAALKRSSVSSADKTSQVNTQVSPESKNGNTKVLDIEKMSISVEEKQRLIADLTEMGKNKSVIELIPITNSKERLSKKVIYKFKVNFKIPAFTLDYLRVTIKLNGNEMLIKISDPKKTFIIMDINKINNFINDWSVEAVE